MAEFGIGLYGMTPDGVLLFMDETAFSLLDLAGRFPSPHALAGHAVSELPGSAVHEQLLHTLRGQEVVRGAEWPLRLSGGGTRWLSEEARLAGRMAGDAPHAQVLVRDVTMRRHRESLLRADQDKYQTILETIHEGYYELDLSGRIVFMNRAMANMLGMPGEDLLGSDFAGRHCAEGGDCVLREAHRLLLEGEGSAEQIVTLEVARPDGRQALLEVSVSLLCDGDSLPLGFRGVCRDITDRKRSEAAARDAEQRYNQLFDEANDIIYTHDMNGYFTSLNRAGERMSGYLSEEARRLCVFDIIAPEHAEQARKMFTTKRMDGDVTRYELEIVARDGRRVPLEVSTRLLLKNGVPGGVLGIARDITERRHAEEERRRLEQKLLHIQKLEGLGELAGGIVRDFNNLLVGVLGNAGLALRRLPKDSPVGIYIKRIEAAAQRASELTGQLMAYSGRSSFVARPVNLARAVSGVLDQLGGGLPDNIEIRSEHPQETPQILADWSQLQQVVLNLITNAVEAIGGVPGIVTVRTGTVRATPEYLAQVYYHEAAGPGLFVSLEVSDNGRGMGEEEKARIFDPFYSTKPEGHGLGLAAILGIVRGHRGAISVYSEPGLGTRFRLLFPAVENVGAPPEPEGDGVGADGGGRLILVADGDKAARGVACSVLKKAGYEVLAASDGQEAVSLFLQHPTEVAAVVVEYFLPRTDGRELAEKLHRLRPDLPVIAASGYGAAEILPLFGGVKPAAFVQKPHQPVVLAGVVSRVLAGDRPPAAE